MLLATMSGKMENYTAKECGEWSNQWCTEHYKYKYYIWVENWGITRRLKGGAAKEVNGEERGIMGGTTDREGVMSWSFPTRCFTFFLYLLASSIFFGRFPTKKLRKGDPPSNQLTCSAQISFFGLWIKIWCISSTCWFHSRSLMMLTFMSIFSSYFLPVPSGYPNLTRYPVFLSIPDPIQF